MTPFINRELSWLEFNRRVLAEAGKPGVLPLDRLKFLAITASNLDEFCMVRIACLNDAKTSSLTDDTGLTAAEQLDLVLEDVRAFQREQAESLSKIQEELRGEGIAFLSIDDLDKDQREYIRQYFEDEVLPVLTPLAIDPARPFPFLSNLSLNIGIRLLDGEGKDLYAVVQVPSILPRFVKLPPGRHDAVPDGAGGKHGGSLGFLPLEELITYYLPVICNLHEIKAHGYFRITRSADFDADEQAENLLEEMKRTIKKRKRGNAIRLELSEGFDGKMRVFLRDMLDLGKNFIVAMPCCLGISAFMKIAGMKGLGHLRLDSFSPVPSPSFLEGENIFAVIREGDRLLHHPYESFDPVVDFIKAAASDPKVLAIKQTLYRVSGRSQVVAALEQAAEAGKQVTVLVELKARFDEENNIQWASRLERSGCHVIYGFTGLKTHCKMTLVVRREGGHGRGLQPISGEQGGHAKMRVSGMASGIEWMQHGIRRYLHLSTGNYNDETARLYTDLGLFTCDPAFGEDASALFNHLTGFSATPEYNKLVVAPEHMKGFFLDRIDREIQNAKAGRPCGISIKANSLLDTRIIKKLYGASEAGVPVKLIIRGICGLLPGVQGYSQKIRVLSIVGKFLEHSRVFIFENAGDPQVFLGSADLMPRNLARRVELVFPVEAPPLKNRIRDIFELMWSDNVCAWELDSDGRYNRVGQEGEAVDAQAILAGNTEEANK
jgi:polyphosphate kinase